MAETRREPVPRDDGGELDPATAFPTFARECVLKKADGLTEEQLRRVLVGSLLGPVHHLTGAEAARHADIPRAQLDGITGP